MNNSAVAVTNAVRNFFDSLVPTENSHGILRNKFLFELKPLLNERDQVFYSNIIQQVDNVGIYHHCNRENGKVTSEKNIEDSILRMSEAGQQLVICHFTKTLLQLPI
jgi:hypothetical protein